MVSLFRPRTGPIGVDLGSRAVKLVQLTADGSRVVEMARWDLPAGGGVSPQERDQQWIDALRQARENRRFHGRDAVLCLGSRELFVQNIRVQRPQGVADLEPIILREAVDRVPFPQPETEVRYLEAGDVRQGEAMRREVIVLACHKPILTRLLNVVERSGLRPVSVDVEPLALLRCYIHQYRRGDDLNQRSMFVHVGHSNSAVVIAQGTEVLFIKYVDLGGKHLDEAVARHLDLASQEAWSLRRHNGDRRADQQDPEVARSVTEATRPIIERLVNEISMCVRYHSVTFRGQPLARMVICGGEANATLVDRIATRIDTRCELGDPFRVWGQQVPGHSAQWDVAVGLALRGVQSTYSDIK